MDIHHLRYFVALSEERHFGRAAERLHMAQPPLSQRIKSLEQQLGMRLFDRRRTGVELTEAGAVLLEHARGVLDRFSAAEEAMRRIRPGETGQVDVAFPPDTHPQTLRVAIAEFADCQPSVLLRLHEKTTEEQLLMLRDGELDVAVVRHPLSTVGLASGPIATRSLGVLLRKDHAQATKPNVALGSLRHDPLVTFPRVMAPMLYDEILGTCRDAGYVPPAIFHARNQSFVLGLVLGGRGVHFNERPWSPLPECVVWRPLEGQPLHWRSSALWLPSRQSEVTDSIVAAVGAGLAAVGHETGASSAPA